MFQSLDKINILTSIFESLIKMVWDRMGGIVMPERESVGILFEIWHLENIDLAWENGAEFISNSANALMISEDEFKQAILGHEVRVYLIHFFYQRG